MEPKLEPNEENTGAAAQKLGRKISAHDRDVLRLSGIERVRGFHVAGEFHVHNILTEEEQLSRAIVTKSSTTRTGDSGAKLAFPVSSLYLTSTSLAFSLSSPPLLTISQHTEIAPVRVSCSSPSINAKEVIQCARTQRSYSQNPNIRRIAVTHTLKC